MKLRGYKILVTFLTGPKQSKSFVYETLPIVLDLKDITITSDQDKIVIKDLSNKDRILLNNQKGSLFELNPVETVTIDETEFRIEWQQQASVKKQDLFDERISTLCPEGTPERNVENIFLDELENTQED